jgi:hypothetical protein
MPTDNVHRNETAKWVAANIGTIQVFVTEARPVFSPKHTCRKFLMTTLRPPLWLRPRSHRYQYLPRNYRTNIIYEKVFLKSSWLFAFGVSSIKIYS